jgi:hypothetical protein
MARMKITLEVEVPMPFYRKMNGYEGESLFKCTDTPGETIRDLTEHKLKGLNDRITVVLISEQESNAKLFNHGFDIKPA